MQCEVASKIAIIGVTKGGSKKTVDTIRTITPLSAIAALTDGLIAGATHQQKKKQKQLRERTTSLATAFFTSTLFREYFS